ncbi:MAG: RNase P modulator RnpM [Thermomicrobiales bacterium]|jgi:predicted RNA-binding protein YlxR (DUF448 family)
MSQNTARPHRAKGPRPKHIPQRMCVSCRERSAKRALIRIVRTPDGTVEIDPTGKRNGRGAYLCDDPACWARSLKSGSLAQALKATIDTETTNTLARYAAGLTPDVNPAPDVPLQEGTTG